MIIAILILSLCMLAYTFCMIWLTQGLKALPPFATSDQKPETYFSLIVPFRNEESHLLSLLQGLLYQEYPETHYEIILVNDASTDNSVTVITRFLKAHPQFPSRLINNKRQTASPKKDALQTAIQQAKHPWIVSTDADCIPPRLWLTTLNAYINMHQPQMIAGPIEVAIPDHKKSLVWYFEHIDVLSLQGTTMAGFGRRTPFMCNGANLAFTREGFATVKGYEGNTHLASGDDHFLWKNLYSGNHKKYII